MSHHNNENEDSPPPSATPSLPASPLLGDVFAGQSTPLAHYTLAVQPAGILCSPVVVSDNTLVSLDGAAPPSDGARAADPLIEQARLAELRADPSRAQLQQQRQRELRSGFSNPIDVHKKPAQGPTP